MVHDDGDETVEMALGPAPARDASRHDLDALRLRRTLESACAPCPELDGPVRRALLCRCPIALACRMLRTAERQEPGAGGTPEADLRSLKLQERALSGGLPPADWGTFALAAERARSLGHDGEGASGCLACRAARIVLELEVRAACGEPAR